MKNLILSLIMFLVVPVTTLSQTNVNGAYVQNGKTTTVDIKAHSIYSVSATDKPNVLYFSDGLSVEVGTNSEISINNFTQTISNTNTYPEKLKAEESTLELNLANGTGYFVYSEDDTNSECTVTTPFADIQLHKGSFYIVVTENNILAVAIDGSFTAYGDKREEKTITAGNALVAIPNNIGILDAKISLSAQKINLSVLSKLNDTIKQLSNIKNNTMFIRIDGKTVAVSL